MRHPETRTGKRHCIWRRAGDIRESPLPFSVTARTQRSRTITGGRHCIWRREGDTCGSLASFSSMAQTQRPRISMAGRHCTGRCKGGMYKSLILFSSMVKIWMLPTKLTGCHLRKCELPQWKIPLYYADTDAKIYKGSNDV